MKRWWLLLIPLVVVGAAVWLVQSDWLREKVRLGIVEQAEKATGGRAELGAFDFDWTTFTATLDRIVIHGTEPAGGAPLLVVERAVVAVHMDNTVRSIVAEKPAVHLIVHADGSTNVPRPKMRGSGFDTILNLKIATFDLRNGTLLMEGKTVPWSAKGENLQAHATYDVARRRYSGEIALSPVQVNWQGRLVEGKLTAAASMEKNRIVIASAHAEAQGGVLDLSDGVVDHGIRAKYTAHYGNDASEGTLRFSSLSDYLVRGTVRGEYKGYRGTGSVEATPGVVKIRDGRADVMGGEAEGNAEIRDLKSFTAKGRVRNVQVRYGATVSGEFEAVGTLTGISSGTFHGQVSGAGKGEVNVRYTGSKIEFGHSWVELPHTRVDLTGTLGDRLTVQLQSTDVADMARALKIDIPLTLSKISFAGTVSGRVDDPRIAGKLAASDIRYADVALDSLTGDVVVTRTSASIEKGEVMYQGFHLRGGGSAGLVDWRPSDASKISVAGEVRKANLTATGTLMGTLAQPIGSGDITLNRGSIYGQPFDSIAGRVQILSRTQFTGTGLFASGAKRVNLSGKLDGRLLEFNMTSNTMALNEISLVRERQPDIHGFGKFHADGTAQLNDNFDSLDLLTITADASANALELGGRNLGDARLTATTSAGVVTAKFESNAAQAAIRGDGRVKLGGEYPLNAKITFAKLGLNAVAALAMKADAAKNLNFDGSAEGELMLTGPLKTPEKLTAVFDVNRLEMHALNLPQFPITNNGPLRGQFTGSSLRVDSARLQAPQTDLNISGSVYPLGLQMRGTINLALAKTFNSDVSALGVVNVDAAAKGTWETPDLSGRASLSGGAFHHADFTNGLTNANGQVVFSGTRATIQSFTAESGGGRVEASGFAALNAGTLNFRIETNATGVRVRYPEGVSSISDARLTLAGTSQRSQASGTVMIHRVAINPKSDAAAILASTAQPLRTPAVRTGLIENVNLDIQVETAPDVTLETSVTQTIQADANLRLRGTVTNPAMLGRINITQGELIFFGNRYTINQGSISFFNPVKIDPILNVDLETKARGVDVILTVAGPVDKLNLSYRSDPPLQFADIVALLATGRTPGDPTQAVRDTGQSQSFQQLGSSALLGQAIANPVAGRLQRFFGVSRLKIDPQLTGITGSPQARLTLEQQVTPDILFTYITDVSSTSTQLIRVEWAYNRNWSAVLTREENGYVGLDFAFKKRFK